MQANTWRHHSLWRTALYAVLLAGFGASQALADGGKDKPDYKPFEEVTEGYTLIDGFLPLYHDPKTDHLLAVIPAKLIGEDLLMARSIASGGGFTGYQFGHTVVRWEEFNKKLILVAPEMRHMRGNGSTVADVIGRTYTDEVMLATPIVTKRGKDPVIDLDRIFKGDFAGLGRLFGGGPDASISKWVKKKVFPNNVELAVENVYMQRNESGTKATVHYSISRLPKSDYDPREADDRIGYFLTARKDWTTDHDADTVFKRQIHRWHLRKSDPSEEVSDVHPDDQIVFYIEKSVPVKYRRYIREGILMWNHAFEKAGLRNAVQVRQQTDSNEFAHLDPEDVNYNFFRWIVSGRSFAMGPSRANPLTGQILDADIIMDDSMARTWAERYDRLTAQGPAPSDDPALNAFYEAHPEWRFQSHEERLMPAMLEDALTDTSWEPEAMKVFESLHPHGMCTYANGAAHEMALGAALLDALVEPGVGRDDYVGQWIRLVACHEVGHTLGLRHNFKASSWKSLDEILANNDEDTPTTASVMDYNPGVYNLDRTARQYYVSQAIGPYDELAIEYGYRVPMKGEKENEMLAGIARRLAENGLDFATDEDTGFLAPDPLVGIYDNTSDPLAWAAYRMDLVDGLREDMTEWGIEDGEGYDRLRRTFDMMLYEYSRVTRFASRLIGGQHVHRHHKGDPNGRPPIEVVAADKQRAALAFLADRVFGAEAFQFSPELLNQLGPGHWRHWGSKDYDSTQEYPVHDRVAAVQYWALFHVTNPVTIGRVYDAELKVPEGEDLLTVSELLDGVTQAVWSEVGTKLGKETYTARKPMIRSMRRALQREHLRLLTRMVLARENRAYPADAVAITRMVLADLGKRIGSAAGHKGIDPATRAHLLDSQTRIEKALAAEFAM